MTSIDVTLNFNYSNITTGRITATPKESFVDGSGNVVQGGIAYPSVAITGGSATLVIPSTKDSGVGYDFVIEEGTAPNYNKVDEFVAVLDNVSPQNGNALITGFYSHDLLDTTVWTLADIMTKPPYIGRLSQTIPGFSFKTYSATQTFFKNDFTFRDNRLYQWINNASGNIDPLTAGSWSDPAGHIDGATPNGASWLVITSSLQGTGMTTSDVNYNKTAFVSLNTEAASRRNLTELDDVLRASITSDLAGYANLTETNTYTGQQIFGGDVTVPDIPIDDDSSKVANTRTLRQIIDASASFADLSTRASILEERYGIGVDVSLISGNNIRQLNTIHLNNGDIVSLTNGIARVKAGTYIVFASAINNRAGGVKTYIYNELDNNTYSTRATTSFTGRSSAENESVNSETTLFDILTFASEATLSLRQSVEVGGSSSGGIGANRSGYSELFSRLVFFRLK